MTLHHRQLQKLKLSHDYVGDSHDGAAQSLRWVLYLTMAGMVAEIAAGYWFGSMALLADGWHMAADGLAFAVNIFGYAYAKKHRGSLQYSFGTWKVGVLAGFASAISLALIGLSVLGESVWRIYYPQPVQYREALLVAVIGFLVNFFCAILLHRGHAHHHDHNHHSAMMHVAADALTSVLAIGALLAGYYGGFTLFDPAAGVIGGALILIWSAQLIRETGGVLIDRSAPADLMRDVQQRIESDADNRVSDLHIWQIGPDHYAAIIALVTHAPKDPAHYKSLLQDFTRLAHISIEVNSCETETCH